MKQRYLFLFLFVFTSFIAHAQKATLTGKITDSKTKEPLVGVTVVAEGSLVVVTNINGEYKLELNAGEHNLLFKYIGYASVKQKVNLDAGENRRLDLKFVSSSSILGEMVVSAGKFQQKMSDVTISIQTIKPAMIENNNTNSIETVIDKVPGVTIMDKQSSIRGGSGYNYGAGSRVLLLVDDMPMLSGDAGDVKWDFAPVENIEQVEVIKGASSALYGSSALNGIINIRTSQPGNTPLTKITINNGIYMNPKRKDIIWWDNTQPMFMGTQFLHSRKIGPLDLTLGGNVFFDEGYREKDDKQRFRMNVNMRYRSKKVKGLSYGLNTNFMNARGHNYLLWLDGDTGVYRVSPAYSQEVDNIRLYADPYITYYRDTSSRHSLRGRYYQTDNVNTTDQTVRTKLFYGEYQYQRQLKKQLTITTGITATHTFADAVMYGDTFHFSTNLGAFAQFDKKIKRFTLSLGARYELYYMDKDRDESKPVCRAGINYKVGRASFLRASFGQGFRYPSIAEKYISSQAGSLRFFPNDTLKPETGWSAEVGYKMGFKLGTWVGYIDMAGFWTQYHNMIEFTFGQHYPNDSIAANPGLNYFTYTGFKAYNISNAQINGYDLTIMSQGTFYGLQATVMAGYTFTNPIDLDVNRDTLKSSHDNMLKYRTYHSAKADIDLEWKDLSLGLSLNYNSFMINIDKIFEEPLKDPQGHPLINANHDTIYFLPGLKQYREKHHNGDLIVDARLSYQVTAKSRISFIVKNLFNREYMGRPGDVRPPRSIALMYALKY